MASIRFCQKCYGIVARNSTFQVCQPTISSNLISKQRRHYRGRQTHNIGRIHGLEIKKAPEIEYKQRGRWREDDHIASGNNCFNTLNFTISGYDIVLVENFSRFAHQLMKKHKQNILETYALPTHDVLFKNAENNTNDLTRMKTDIALPLYKRVIQVKDIPSLLYPILLQILMHTVPQSVTFQVKEHSEADVDARNQQKTELEAERKALKLLMDAR